MSESQLQQAFALIDAINRTDPVTDLDAGVAQPKEWLYGLRMTACLAAFIPNASLALQIAARAQHIKRWTQLRSDYPLGREGYYQWRQSLARMHAHEAMAIARQVGCDNDEIVAIGRMLRKEKIKRDAQVQALEDVICLVFLQHYFSAFAAKHNDDKLIIIIQKTWQKMSATGQLAALKLPFSEAQQALLKRALG